MISITMGYENRGRKIQNIFKNKATLVTVLFLILSGYLGVKIWNTQTAAGTVAEAASNPEQIFAQVSVDRHWILLGSEFTFKQKSLPFQVELSPEFAGAPLSYAISGTDLQGRMIGDGNGRYSAEIFVGNLNPGRYAVSAQVESGSETVSSQEVEFNVSYPLYVTWTMDWEGYDVKQEYLDEIDKIADGHGTPITHFFNPRIYVASEISPQRADYLTSWVIARRERRGDEIGLHLHMFEDMVRAAGVTPRQSPDWGSTLKEGYDTLTSAYTYEETMKLINWSQKIFAERGLGTPISFRAGGWFADGETLRALQDTGFALDSSGRTPDQAITTNIDGLWNLKAATNPYQPNVNDQNSAQAPHLDLWEFPNNGADSWAYSEDQMYARFNTNFTGAPLKEKQAVTFLSHPHWFNRDNPKIEGLYTRVDRFLNSRDGGPVVYITLGQAYQIWAGR